MFFDHESFDFPMSGVHCQSCGTKIPSRDKRRTGYCLDCEFDKVAFPAWPEVFMVSLARWMEDH